MLLCPFKRVKIIRASMTTQAEQTYKKITAVKYTPSDGQHQECGSYPRM